MLRVRRHRGLQNARNDEEAKAVRNDRQPSQTGPTIGSAKSQIQRIKVKTFAARGIKMTLDA